MRYNFRDNKFIEQELHPEKIAISGSDRDLNWATLEALTLELVSRFSVFGIPVGHPVIIYGHKECLFPVVMLACIHAKIPYIPIDKIYPKERIKKIIETTGTQVLINCSNEELDIPIPIVFNSMLDVRISSAADFKDKIYGTVEEPLQYIMFTSGSTGEPKGVLIYRSSVLTFIDWALRDFGFCEDDVFMNQAPFTFDVSLCDVLNAFSQGGTLVLTSTESVKNQDEFLDRLQRYKCSVWTSTPSFAYLFLRHPNFRADYISTLKTFLFMGEELPGRTIGILRKKFDVSRILNAYGPTEATIVTTLIHITEEISSKYTATPIGYPMPDSELLIDKKSPDDKEGELIIVGEHVSGGYFKNEELNQQKFFIYNGKRAFRTGDIAYYEDGMLFFLGRNDDQVKMHGFRIELNEISNVLCKNELIADAVSVALRRNNEVKKIVSFVILKNEESERGLLDKLMPELKNTLPYYMIPGDLMIVKAFPTNTSHKIDKNKLIEDYLKRQMDDNQVNEKETK